MSNIRSRVTGRKVARTSAPTSPTSPTSRFGRKQPRQPIEPDYFWANQDEDQAYLRDPRQLHNDVLNDIAAAEALYGVADRQPPADELDAAEVEPDELEAALAAEPDATAEHEDDGDGDGDGDDEANHTRTQTTRPKITNMSRKKSLPPAVIIDMIQAASGGALVAVGAKLCWHADGKVTPLLKAAQLFGRLHGVANIDWSRSGITKEEFAFAATQYVPQYAWAYDTPHFPPRPDILYTRPPVEARNTGAIKTLVDRFAPATPHDRTLIVSLILTLLWGGEPGKRPMYVFTSDDPANPKRGRGSGKTTAAEVLATLAGGHVPVFAHSRDGGNIVTDLLSTGAMRKRVALLDNLKSSHFSSERIEALITSGVIGGHDMYLGHGERPNDLTWVCTVNGASLSLDLAERSIVVQVLPRPYTLTWHRETLAYVATRREAIYADAAWYFRQPPQHLARIDRWDAWCGEILARLPDPDAVLDMIEARRRKVDGDTRAGRDLAAHVRHQIEQHYRNQAPGGIEIDADTIQAHIPSSVLRKILGEGLGEDVKLHKLDSVVAQYLPHRLRRKNTKHANGFMWRGRRYPDDDAATPDIWLRPLTHEERRR